MEKIKHPKCGRFENQKLAKSKYFQYELESQGYQTKITAKDKGLMKLYCGETKKIILNLIIKTKQKNKKSRLHLKSQKKNEGFFFQDWHMLNSRPMYYFFLVLTNAQESIFSPSLSPPIIQFEKFQSLQLVFEIPPPFFVVLQNFILSPTSVCEKQKKIQGEQLFSADYVAELKKGRETKKK